MKPNINSRNAGIILEFSVTAGFLKGDNLKHLVAAEGYAELEMFLDANAEIENIDAELRDAPEVLAMRLGIYRALGKWEFMRIVAAKLSDLDPGNPRLA